MEERSSKINTEKIALNFFEIKRSLLHRFLYQADSDAIQILLNIYKIEEQVDNVFPSYISIKSLKKDLMVFLRNKIGKELISSNLSDMIHDDINRLELVIYLFGYRRGLKSVQQINELEIFALKNYGVENLYYKKSLFHFEKENHEILRFKEKIFNEIEGSKTFKKNFLSMLHLYNKKVLKSKVFSINEHVDRQISIDVDSRKTRFIEVENHLSFRELKGLNKKLMLFLYRDGVRIYEAAFWNGLNDSVLRRYSL